MPVTRDVPGHPPYRMIQVNDDHWSVTYGGRTIGFTWKDPRGQWWSKRSIEQRAIESENMDKALERICTT